jgi:hypothetical protein
MVFQAEETQQLFPEEHQELLEEESQHQTPQVLEEAAVGE